MSRITPLIIIVVLLFQSCNSFSLFEEKAEKIAEINISSKMNHCKQFLIYKNKSNATVNESIQLRGIDINTNEEKLISTFERYDSFLGYSSDSISLSLFLVDSLDNNGLKIDTLRVNI